ncbi:MAG: hypothetical protein NC900_03455 [Candidatus Omnitrophica bacterium]|nr:hypothetical protein [Candidatus Omnitrophota bacterium]MCM8799770.1 hypothetical protein [Candidatus Omnitrophota bacterium]
MEKNLSPNQETILPSRFRRIIQKILVGFKLLLGVLFIPFVYGSTKAFLEELFVLENSLKVSFFSGIIIFLIIYLFIWEPTVIYKKGQRFVQIIFGFFSPLVKVAPYLLPIYTIILFLIYFLFSSIIKSTELDNNFMFLFGLSITLHLIFSAKVLKSRPSDYLKANYIFGFSFIYLINIFILAFGFNLIWNKFSFVNFFNQSYQIALDIISIVFRQLFL